MATEHLDTPSILRNHEQRIAAIEGVVTQVERRLDSLEHRMFWMWGSTMLVMLAGFATLILRGGP